jgi:hypothetical protein
MAVTAKTNRGDEGKRPARRRPSANRWRNGPALTARDEEILRWITRHGVVTAELVARRFFWRPERKTHGQWAAYRRLAALDTRKLLIRDKPFASKPEVIRVTREGARVADVGLRPARLVLSELDHSIAVVFLAERLLAEHGGSELTTERELRAQRYRERLAGDRRATVGRTPDALLRLPGKTKRTKALTVAVELDLTRKDRRALERIIDQYDEEPDVDAIWWYVPDVRVQRIKDLVAQQRAQRRIDVRPWRLRR